MCKPRIQGGYRSPNYHRLRKLTTADLVDQEDHNAPTVTWQQTDLKQFWSKEAEYHADQCAAILKLESIKPHVPSITRDIQQIAAQVDGKCVNLRERLKSPHSIAQDISAARDEAAKHGLKISAAEVTENLNDIVRYSIVCGDHDDLTDAVAEMMAGLQSKGWKVHKISGFHTDNSSAKRLKITCETSSQVRVALQVHSTVMFRAANNLKDIEEIYKDRDARLEDRKVAREICLEHFQHIPAPSGLDSISVTGRKDAQRIPF